MNCRGTCLYLYYGKARLYNQVPHYYQEVA